MKHTRILALLLAALIALSSFGLAEEMLETEFTFLDEGAEEVAPEAEEADAAEEKAAAVTDFVMDGTTLVQYVGKATNVTFPKKLTVTEIGSEAFCDNAALKSVTLPETVTAIGDYAFAGCVKLATVKLPKKLESIGGGAFDACASLKTIAIPGTVKEIPSAAFCGCEALTKVTLNVGTEIIGEEAFRGNKKLKSIVLPQGLQRIEYGAFLSCDALKAVTLPYELTAIGESAFDYANKGMVWTVYVGSFADEVAADNGVAVKYRKDYKYAVRNKVATLEPEEVATLEDLFTLYPDLPDNSEVTLKSSAPKTLGVNHFDKVAFGVAHGKAKLTAKFDVCDEYGKSLFKKSLSATVNVVDPNLPESVSIAGNTEVNLNRKLQLTAQFTPETAKSTLSWKSSNVKVATVDQNGLVTPVKMGTTKITVTATNGSIKKTATVTVKVIEEMKQPNLAIADENGDLFDEINLSSGQQRFHLVDRDGSDFLDGADIMFWCGKDEIADVNEVDGVFFTICAKDAGGTDLKANFYVDGEEYLYTFPIKVWPEMYLDAESIVTPIGEFGCEWYYENPDYYDHQYFSYSTDNPDMLEIEEYTPSYVTLRGKKIGQCTLFANFNYQGATFTYTVPITIVPNLYFGNFYGEWIGSKLEYTVGTLQYVYLCDPDDTGIFKEARFTFEGNNPDAAIVSGYEENCFTIGAVRPGEGSVTATMHWKDLTYTYKIDFSVRPYIVFCDVYNAPIRKVKIRVGESFELKLMDVSENPILSEAERMFGVIQTAGARVVTTYSTSSGTTVTGASLGNATIYADVTYKGITYRYELPVEVYEPSLSCEPALAFGDDKGKQLTDPTIEIGLDNYWKFQLIDLNNSGILEFGSISYTCNNTEALSITDIAGKVFCIEANKVGSGTITATATFKGQEFTCEIPFTVHS